MKPVRLLISMILLGGLGGLVWWSNQTESSKGEKPDKDAPPKILSLASGSVKQIDIKRRAGEFTSVRLRDQESWELTAPKKLTADPAAVISLSNATSNLTAERVVDENATDLASYGLAPALLEVAFTTKDGKTTKLLIGENTPTGSSAYARLDGDPRLFTIAGFTKSAFDKTAQDLRDRRLLPFVQEKLTRIQITSRKEAFEFGKAGETDWQITKPKVMRADSTQIENLIAKLRNASMEPLSTEEDAKKSLAAFTVASTLATVKVTDSAGSQSLEVRKSKEGYFAKSSAVEGAHKVGQDIGDDLDKSLDTFRNKKLFDFGFSDPSKIEVRDGSKTLTLEKSGEKWLSPGKKEMDSTSVQAFIDRLRDFSAAAFAEKGFTTAIVTITVVSNNGKRSETLEVSQAASAQNFIGRRAGDASLYELGADPVKELRQAVGDVRETQPGKKK